MNDLFDQSSKGKRLDSRVISIRGAREHNLKNVDVAIPRDQLVVFTGLSGSGKSSLAFDTIYAEGQRRYVESLSAYARQFLEMMQKPDVDQIDGLSPAISIEQKTTSKNPRSTVGTVTEIYDYMRLLVGAHRRALLARHRAADREPDRLADGRPHPGAAGRHAALSAGAGRARPQGRVPQGARRLPQARLPAREGRRPVLRDRRGARARQEIHPRHRRGGRPHRGARRHRHAAGGFVGAGAEARRRPRDRRAGRRRGGRRRQGQQAAQRDRRAADLLGEIRLPGVGLHHPGDRAAAVLVQQPVRRLPEMRRPRRRAAYRRRPRDPRSRRDAAQGRDRAVVEVVVALLHPDAHGAGQALQVHPRQQVEGAAEGDAEGDPLRLRRGRGDPLHLRRRRAQLHHQEAVRGRDHQSRAPLQGDRERLGARGDRPLLHRHPLRRLQGRAAQAGIAVREGRRKAHRRGRRHVGQGLARMVHRAAPAADTRSRTRSASACSRKSATG